MVQFTATATLLAFAMTALAIPAPITLDPSGDSRVGNQKGQQFIGSECINSLDCNPNSACCASFFNAATSKVAGICSGLAVANTAGKTGCGFGDGAAPAPPATPAPANGNGGAGNGNTGTVTLKPNEPGAQNVGKANGAQFITGQCLSDADCASGCCATGGACAARAVVDGANDARQCGFIGVLGGAGNGAAPAPPAPPATPAPGNGGNGGAAVTLKPDAPGSQNVGKANGAQFITGQCLSDADCASGCCATGGACAARAVVEEPSDARQCGFVGVLA